MNSPERSGQKEKTDLQRINLKPLMDAIGEYNRQFSFGSLLAEEVLHEQHEGEVGDGVKKLSVGELSSDFFDTLETTGLSAWSR